MTSTNTLSRKNSEANPMKAFHDKLQKEVAHLFKDTEPSINSKKEELQDKPKFEMTKNGIVDSYYYNILRCYG